MNYILKVVVLTLLIAGINTSAYGQAAASEAELRKQADKAFADENFETALSPYSQLLSLRSADPVLNYRYGVCLLLAGKEKSGASAFLENASSNPTVPSEVWYYLGQAYMVNGNFEKAAVTFQKYRDQRVKKKQDADAWISYARNGIELKKNTKSMTILSEREETANGFQNFYQFGSGGRMIPTADQFITAADREKQKEWLMFISADKQTIVYSSYGKTSSQGKDIYLVRKLANGSWGDPQSLGPVINSLADEDLPVLDRDGKTLYFSSKGHNSIGGYDLFRSVLDLNTGEWSAPENLGLPVNSIFDDVFFFPNEDGKTFTYSTYANAAKGKLNIRNIELPAISSQAVRIAGFYAPIDQRVRRDARITILNSTGTGIVAITNTDPRTGSYELFLPPGNEYMIVVEGGGYLPHAELFNLPAGAADANLRQIVKLNKTKEKEELMLQNFFTAAEIPTQTVNRVYAAGDSTALVPVTIQNQTVMVTAPGSENRSSTEQDKQSLPTVNIQKKDKYDPTLDRQLSADEIRQKQEEENRTLEIAHEDKTPDVEIDYDINNDEIIRLAYNDAKAIQKEADELKKESFRLKSYAQIKDSLAADLMTAAAEAESETERKNNLTQANTLQDEALELFKQSNETEQLAMQKQKQADESLQEVKTISGNDPKLVAKIESDKKKNEEKHRADLEAIRVEVRSSAMLADNVEDPSPNQTDRSVSANQGAATPDNLKSQTNSVSSVDKAQNTSTGQLPAVTSSEVVSQTTSSSSKESQPAVSANASSSRSTDSSASNATSPVSNSPASQNDIVAVNQNTAAGTKPVESSSGSGTKSSDQLASSTSGDGNRRSDPSATGVNSKSNETGIETGKVGTAQPSVSEQKVNQPADAGLAQNNSAPVEYGTSTSVKDQSVASNKTSDATGINKNENAKENALAGTSTDVRSDKSSSTGKSDGTTVANSNSSSSGADSSPGSTNDQQAPSGIDNSNTATVSANRSGTSENARSNSAAQVGSGNTSGEIKTVGTPSAPANVSANNTTGNPAANNDTKTVDSTIRNGGPTSAESNVANRQNTSADKSIASERTSGNLTSGPSQTSGSVTAVTTTDPSTADQSKKSSGTETTSLNPSTADQTANPSGSASVTGNTSVSQNVDPKVADRSTGSEGNAVQTQQTMDPAKSAGETIAESTADRSTGKNEPAGSISSSSEKKNDPTGIASTPTSPSSTDKSNSTSSVGPNTSTGANDLAVNKNVNDQQETSLPTGSGTADANKSASTSPTVSSTEVTAAGSNRNAVTTDPPAPSTSSIKGNAVSNENQNVAARLNDKSSTAIGTTDRPKSGEVNNNSGQMSKSENVPSASDASISNSGDTRTNEPVSETGNVSANNSAPATQQNSTKESTVSGSSTSSTQNKPDGTTPLTPQSSSGSQENLAVADRSDENRSGDASSPNASKQGPSGPVSGKADERSVANEINSNGKNVGTSGPSGNSSTLSQDVKADGNLTGKSAGDPSNSVQSITPTASGKDLAGNSVNNNTGKVDSSFTSGNNDVFALNSPKEKSDGADNATEAGVSPEVKAEDKSQPLNVASGTLQTPSGQNINTGTGNSAEQSNVMSTGSSKPAVVGGTPTGNGINNISQPNGNISNDGRGSASFAMNTPRTEDPKDAGEIEVTVAPDELADLDLSEINTKEEARLAYQAYRTTGAVSKVLSYQSEQMQVRVNAMKAGPERDSLIRVSNEMTMESVRQWQMSQRQLNDAKSIDPLIEEKVAEARSSKRSRSETTTIASRNQSESVVASPSSDSEIKVVNPVSSAETSTVRQNESTVPVQEDLSGRVTADNRVGIRPTENAVIKDEINYNKAPVYRDSTGLNTSHPKYTAYVETQKQVTAKQVETIDVFAEAVNLNKKAMDEKQMQIDLLDSAYKESDEAKRSKLQTEANEYKSRYEENMRLSEEKFATAKQRIGETKQLSSKLNEIRNEIASADDKVYEPVADARRNVVPTGTKSDSKTSVKYRSLNEALGKADGNDLRISRTELASQPSPEVQQIDSFSKVSFSRSAVPVYSATNPIPMDAPLPEGLVFKVQIGAFRKPIDADNFKNIQPLSGESTRPGWIRYCAGMFKTFEGANTVKKEVRNMGYKDAFVVAYYNGKRIGLNEAYAMVNRTTDVKEAYKKQAIKEAVMLQAIKVEPVSATLTDEDEKTFYASGTKLKSNTSTDKADEIVYSVQIGVYRSASVPRALSIFDPVEVSRIKNELYRFTYGVYDQYAAADLAKREAISKGVTDAFIIAYKNGQRVSPTVAARQTDKAVELPTVAAKNNTQTTGTVTPAVTKQVVQQPTASLTDLKPDAAVPANVFPIESTAVTGGPPVFKVQIGAFRNFITYEKVVEYMAIADKGITQLKDDRGLHIFYVGSCKDFSCAQALKQEIVSKGIADAFVVALKDGKRITITDEMKKRE